MPDEPEIPLVWCLDARANSRGFHAACATWLSLEPSGPQDRQPKHTEICLGCGRFLLTPPTDHGNSKPSFDSKLLLS